MTSEVEYRANFNYWSQNEKWKGFFFVVWLIIKDIPNRIFTNIINEYNENKPVTSSRDTQEIHPFAGAEMLRIFKQYQYDSSILDDFNFFEKRQEKLSTRPNNLQINLSNMNNIDDGAVSRDVYNKFSHDQGNFSNYVENFNTNLNQSSYSSIPNDKSKYEMYGRVDSQLKYEKIENNNTNDNKFLEFQPNMYRDNRNNFENTPGMSGTLDKSFNLPSYNNLVDRSLTINEEQNKIKRVIKRINSTDNILKSTVAKNKEEND